MLHHKRIKEIGLAFKKNDGYYDHMYLQREHDVLHVNVKGQVLNTLHVGFLNYKAGLIEITYKEFIDNVREFMNEAMENSELIWHIGERL